MKSSAAANESDGRIARAESALIVDTIQEAVQLLTSGRCRESLPFLRCALDDLKASHVAAAASSDDHQMTSTDRPRARIKCTSVSFDDERCNDDSVPLYSHCLQLVPEDGCNDRIFCLLEHQHRAAAMLLYNMALVHHLLGMSASHEYEANHSLKKASNLYGVAIEIIYNLVYGELEESSAQDKFILLAATNNQAHICLYRQWHSLAQVCMKQLRQVLDQFDRRDDQQHDELDLVCFRRSVLLWDSVDSVKTSTAPAA